MSKVYKLLSGTKIFLAHYRMVAQDIAHCGEIDTVLDIGTGPAHLLQTLRDEIPDSSIIGMDISQAMVAEAARNIQNQDRTYLCTAEAKKLPFSDDTFSIVVSTGSFHHWKDRFAAIEEAERVVKPGGYVLLFDLVSKMPPDISLRVRSQFGSFYLALLWLHSFEEPFSSVEELADIGRESTLRFQGTHFVGALCCLTLQPR